MVGRGIQQGGVMALIEIHYPRRKPALFPLHIRLAFLALILAIGAPALGTAIWGFWEFVQLVGNLVVSMVPGAP